jgi:3-keto-disaccharide hydrolase
MRPVMAVLWIQLLTSGCGPGPVSTPASDATSDARPTARDEGWTVLFDGASTDAWRGYGGDAFPDAGWRVEDGALATVPGAPVDLLSRDTFADFELEFEWRVTPGGNGGVMYRVTESRDPAWTTGPEYQVLDDAGHPDGGRPATSAGALYDLIAPSTAKTLAPVGDFNTARIVVRSDHVEHWLNGELIVSYEWGGDDVRALIDASKFADLPGFMAATGGHIVLQHHGAAVAYRNIRIRR